MAPPAPGLLSTTTGTPICLLSASAISRMLMSLPPPAGHATINVIGSEGYVCACEPGEPATVSRCNDGGTCQKGSAVHLSSPS